MPESANDAFQVAVQDCLPHLFADNPALLQQAVAAVSPNELRARGVPVCRWACWLSMAGALVQLCCQSKDESKPAEMEL